MKVFSCVYHAPDTVVEFIYKSLGITPTDIHIVGDSVNKKRVQIFLNYKSFVRLHKTLPKTKDLIVVVFGQPFEFFSWNLIPLDYKEAEEPYLNAFEYLPLDRKVLRTNFDELLYKHRSYLTKILDTVSSFDSLLHGLMSFIYTMKTPEQKIAKEAACRYLYKGHGMDVLRRDLSSLNDRQIERMLMILSADVAARIQRAFADPISIEERSRVHNVSAYELRYIESIASKAA